MARVKTSSVREAQNAAKTLYANINFASVDEPIKSIVITSTIPNEGKSTVALYLAEAAAQSGKRTLLVECDMRRRSLANMLGTHTRFGLYAVLSGQANLEQATVATTTGARFLDAEPRVPNPADLLQSKRFAQLMKNMENAFDLVVIDTPPVGTFVDAAIVAAHAGAAALVVRENFTRRADATAALEQLRKADANVIGAVMNFCVAQSSEYYYAYYNKDGKRVKKSRHVEAEASALKSVSAIDVVPGPQTRGGASGGNAAAGTGAASSPVKPVSPTPHLSRKGGKR